MEAKTTLISVADRFDASKHARLTSFAWFHVVSHLQQLCQSEGALLPMTSSANRDLARLDQAESDLSQQTGQGPTLAEAATKVSFSFVTCDAMCSP